MNEAGLGFHIGPICVGATCCADDTYILSDSPSGLQSSMDIVSHYAGRYRVIFNADKTKIVVTGSKHDMLFYKDTKPWKLNGERVSVVENNDHLGLVVSGLNEEQKNIDQNIVNCRNSMFALLGPAFAFKCKLNPVLQSHLWRTYNLPVLLSGLAALPIRPADSSSLTIFHHKILRGFLKLSQSSPIPSLYFLLGELPLENKLHLETLSLFYTIWANPSTKIHQIMKYILMMSKSSSTTLSNHIRILCSMYSLPDPLTLLNQSPCSKVHWKSLTKTRVTIFAEKKWRSQASTNSKMTYLNVELFGLSGRQHPALFHVYDTREVMKMRLHLKFLTGDYLSFRRLAEDNGKQDTHCRICPADMEDIQHILVECRGTAEVRSRLLPELLNTVSVIQPCSGILDHQHLSPRDLTQFILDCGSFNLINKYRLSYENPGIFEIYRVARNWSFGIHDERKRILKQNHGPF